MWLYYMRNEDTCPRRQSAAHDSIARGFSKTGKADVVLTWWDNFKLSFIGLGWKLRGQHKLLHSWKEERTQLLPRASAKILEHGRYGQWEASSWKVQLGTKPAQLEGTQRRLGLGCLYHILHRRQFSLEVHISEEVRASQSSVAGFKLSRVAVYTNGKEDNTLPCRDVCSRGTPREMAEKARRGVRSYLMTNCCLQLWIDTCLIICYMHANFICSHQSPDVPCRNTKYNKQKEKVRRAN